MKHIIILLSLLIAIVTLGGCADELVIVNTNTAYTGQIVEAFLDITVSDLAVTVGTRADDITDTEAERWVNDLWLFQYDATTGQAIATPQYVVISDQDELTSVPVMVSDNNGSESTFYVVTNTSDSEWGYNSDYNTIGGLLAGAIPSREPIFLTDNTLNSELSIPMQGSLSTVVTVGETITVPVTRMFAKLMINPVVAIDNAEVSSVGLQNIPYYCRVGGMSDGTDATAATYPESVQWISRYFYTPLTAADDDDATEGTSDSNYRYVVYIPENIAGQTENTESSKIDDSDAPSKALAINIQVVRTDDQGGTITYPYVVYPGANSNYDYNLRRNNVYRVTVTISNLSIQRVPSANCIVGLAGQTLTFFPYYRVETGGGYDFTDYLNPNPSDDSTGQKIDHLKIIWQTEECIGDNSEGDLVYLSKSGEETHDGYEQIYVVTKNEGNALIGAYNTNEDIIWSWHIWVRSTENGDPTDLANAETYYTYDWDNTQIYDYFTETPRVPGYQIMSCNLGALQDEPDYNKNTNFGNDGSVSGAQAFQDGDCITRTYGMLYQWGRKDPFPPMKSTQGQVGNNATGFNTGYYVHNYDTEHTEQHYDNAMEPVTKTSYAEEDSLFHTYCYEGDTGGVKYAIAHPTVFLTGVSNPAQSLKDAIEQNKGDATDYVKSVDSYPNKGDWCVEDRDNKEWGCLEPDDTEKHYNTKLLDDKEHEMIIYDDYETADGSASKSIFDPCPYGWRVPPGDLWLGFAKNGLNALDDPLTQNNSTISNSDGSIDNINCDPDRSCVLGMSMYLGAQWRTGLTAWFPAQGFLFPDGCGFRVGGCGNYVNATTDKSEVYDRVNMLHLHDQVNLFRVFEKSMPYTVKSSANPVRCVRDTK